MQFQRLDNNTYILRLVKAEKIMETLAQFCQAQDIEGGYLSGLGAVSNVELAHFDPSTQQYSSQTFNEPLEIASINGTIANYQGELVLHLHGTFGRQDFTTLAGHINNGTISGTLELFLHVTEPLIKAKDPATGLKLLQLNQDLDKHV